LNTFAPIAGMPVKGTSPLDSLLNTNKGMQLLENITLFLKGSVDNKFFQGKTGFAGRMFHRVVNNTIMKLRKTSLFVFKLGNYKELKKINKTFMHYPENSPEYIEEIAKIGNSTAGKYIIMNVENNPLRSISKSNEAVVFVLNHPNYHRDKYTYAILNSLLNKLYVEEGKQSHCPVPKIIVSGNMLNAVGKNIGEMYKKLGMVTVDAGVEHRDMFANAFKMKHLLTGFVKDKINLFIFPEGRNSMRNMPLEKRLQPGVASFLDKALNMKQSAKIIPVGIKYTNAAGCYGKIYIGKPVYVKKSGGEVIYTSGTEFRKVKRADAANTVDIILNQICESMEYCIKKADLLV